MVVPNPDLANNHQEELALKMQELQYGVMATVGYANYAALLVLRSLCANLSRNVVDTIDEAEKLRSRKVKFQEMSSEAINSALTDQLQIYD